MEFLKKWFKRKERTDLDKVKVTSSGRFHMRSEDLFDDKDEVLRLIEKLDKSVESFNKKAKPGNLAHTE